MEMKRKPAILVVQVVKGQLSCDLDAGWFVKLVNSGTGTHLEAFMTGEKNNLWVI